MNTNQCMAAAASKQRSKLETGGIVLSATFAVGDYVTYKGNPYLVTAVELAKVKILNPKYKFSALHVIKSNVSLLDIPRAKVVPYKGYEYLVTAKDLIVSLRTRKAMNWSDNDGNRIGILAVKYALDSLVTFGEGGKKAAQAVIDHNLATLPVDDDTSDIAATLPDGYVKMV